MFLNLKRKKMKTSRKNKNVKESLGGKWKGTIMVAILMKINVAQYFSYLTLCTKWVLLCCLFKLFKSDVELERSQIYQVEKLIKPIPSACIGSVWSQPEAKKAKLILFSCWSWATCTSRWYLWLTGLIHPACNPTVQHSSEMASFWHTWSGGFSRTLIGG